MKPLPGPPSGRPLSERASVRRRPFRRPGPARCGIPRPPSPGPVPSLRPGLDGGCGRALPARTWRQTG